MAVEAMVVETKEAVKEAVVKEVVVQEGLTAVEVKEVARGEEGSVVMKEAVVQEEMRAARVVAGLEVPSEVEGLVVETAVASMADVMAEGAEDTMEAMAVKVVVL